MTIEIPAEDMLLFARVVSEGSFTKAALSLGIAKQSVSHRISKLEEALGVRLLERTTRSLRTTNTGAAYYERCLSISTQVEEANREARDRQAEPHGTLRVSAPYLFGRRFLAPIITKYLKRYPSVSVEIALGDGRVNLVQQGFDLAIRTGQLEDSTLSARALGRVRLSPCASPSFLEKHPVHTFAKLDEAWCIGRPGETWDVGGVRRKIEARLVLNDLELAAEAARAGLGIARLPSLLTTTHLRNGSLVELWPEHAQYTSVHAIFPSRQFLSAKVRVFLDLLSNGALLQGLAE
jgi:DNA-binding transcriptional LysR family regulator